MNNDHSNRDYDIGKLVSFKCTITSGLLHSAVVSELVHIPTTCPRYGEYVRSREMLATVGRRAWQASAGARTTLARTLAPSAPLSSLQDPTPRNYGEIPTSVENRSSAKDALEKSCYFKIDFSIPEDAMVYEAVQRFAAYNIGALAVTNAKGKVIGIVSERDYVSKVALLGKKSKSTPIQEIATMGVNLVVAAKSDTVQECMTKMVSRDIRHLPVVDEENGQVVGMLSIKDLLKEVTREREELMTKITEFKLGRGGFFEHT